MKTIELSGGKVALVDDDQYNKLSSFVWTTQKRASGDFHAARYNRGKYEYMHQHVLAPRPGFQIDHINNDGLDNRRKNLRCVTKQQNQWNRKRTWGYSKYKGVIKPFMTKKGPRYPAGIQDPVTKKRISLGYFPTEEEAARAYDRKAKELFGEFARLNFPDDNLVLEKAA